MKAVVFEKYGGPLQLKEVQKPSPGEGEVLVRIHAVSLNDWDWGKMDGKSWFNRLLSGFRKPKHTILGSDVAGVVEAIGGSVTKFQPGDEVYGDLSGRWGGLAEYVCAPERLLERKPARMDFIDAASIPQASLLAVQGLIDRGEIKPGQKILINGAGGGVGTFGIQIARLHGVDVSVVDSGEKLDMLRGLGAVEVIDYTKTDFTIAGTQYDLILDVKTNRPVLKYLKALKPHGIYVTVGGSISLLSGTLLLMPFLKLFSGKKVRIVMLKANKDLGYMGKLYEQGKLRPVIDGPYPLEEVPQAFERFGKAKHLGKIVISIN